MNEPTKVAVSISEMARMVGLSRQRFHQLKGTTFPEPMRDPETNRPFYDEELQQLCLEVRRRNCEPRAITQNIRPISPPRSHIDVQFQSTKPQELGR
jgi:hypothetical protein